MELVFGLKKKKKETCHCDNTDEHRRLHVKSNKWETE